MKPRFFAVALLVLCASGAHGEGVKLDDAEAARIGQRIWRNECAGTRDGLTSWNKGEDFASLGIGHFIWYPQGKRGPFKESFPALRDYLAANGVKLPAWLASAKSCPWPDRASFMADFRSDRMEQLRALLASTVGQQARFAALRLESALPQMLSAAPAPEREKIRANFYRVANAPGGLYALMDYVNFKGEGTSPTERYQSEGWGLLQVLAGMPDSGSPTAAFSQSADRVLTRRVQLSPPARGESRWLPGWRNRVATYAP
ncbi:MAG: hypothetical protein FGM15_06070 [Chthoniobacterales bacterium]|nr:hypothetical protein [Chthoniobacterales bacterium]